MEFNSLPVLDLYLDPDNPRHEPIKDQPKIMEELIAKEKVKRLARSIAEEGINPLELFAVVKDKSGNKFVIEGNRRTCALLALNDPALAPAGERKYFAKLAQGSEAIPDKVNVVEFSSKDEARIWLERRHNGEQDGAGLVPWKSDQKARFFGGSNNNALAVKLLDYAVKEGLITDEDRQGRILTTATRYLGNPVFRDTIGVSSGRSDPEVKISVKKEAFNKVLGRFCKDLVTAGGGVSSRSKSKDWVEYARKLKKQGIAPKVDDHTEEYSLSDAAGSKLKTKKRKRNSPNPDSRKTIVSSDFSVKINNKILSRVCIELKRLDCDEFPFAASGVCRSFLEDVYRYYHEKVIGKRHSGKMNEVLAANIKQIESIKESLTHEQHKALGALRRVNSNENHVFSPKTLGAFAHASHTPDSRQLKREWDNVSAIVEFMVDKVWP
ncbi:hypothetical protein [Marinimicrobium sp. ARAG 43.8]|uniref:hypothetical protein n=1 Tax=Marinimicrobium sp. ARAG 43.8 TaxID=3418719 RepID=UPI003CF18270